MPHGFKPYSIKTTVSLFNTALKELMKNDPLRMAGATAFFTTFALPPILIIIIQLLSLVYNPEAISAQLFEKLGAIIGVESVQQIVETLGAFRKLAQNWYVTLGGFIFLVFVATTLFKVIKSSINQVWKIRVLVKQNFWFDIRSRLLSVLVILIAGVLFMAGLMAEGVQAFLGKYIAKLWPGVASYLNSVANHLVSVVIVTLWFAIVFRYLSDGKPRWKIALTGAFVTGVLFTMGKLLLRWLLSYSNINTVYGASGSIVLLLLFVFYASLILYYGAAFTKIWGAYRSKPIMPRPHAIRYQLAEADIEEE